MTIYESVFKIKTFLQGMRVAHAALAVFLLCLMLFLAVRASDEYRWSDWGFGDAQTMLSLRQWDEEGWFNNYFLFIPQGYAKIVKLFDDPELRHHAHGTCPGSAPGVGPRLWYTHYPSGYLVPYAALFKIGLDDIFHARMLSIAFSITALVLMFMVFSKIASRQAAFFAVFFYGISPVFLGYADSIANQPFDDMIRFGFMLLTVMAFETDDKAKAKKLLVFAWLSEFALSLSSFDSVFFIYTWLVGWDILVNRKFRWKLYLIFSLAPIIAHSLQLLQNVWYFGIDTAIQDIKVTFMQKSGGVETYGGPSQSRFELVFTTLLMVLNSVFSPYEWLAAVLVMFLSYVFFLRGNKDSSLPSLAILCLLFLCGLAYVFVLPHGARMPYQGRQMAPFVGMLIGGFTWSAAKSFRAALHGDKEEDVPALSSAQKYALPVYLLLSCVILIIFWYRLLLHDRHPVYKIPETPPNEMSVPDKQRFGNLMAGYRLRGDLLLAKELKKMPTRYEPVYLDLGGFSSYWDPNYVPGYPQINPIVEFYAGSRPVLCFNYPDGIVNDIIYLLQKSPQRFSPVLVSRDLRLLEVAVSQLGERGALIAMPPQPLFIVDRYVVDLSDFLRWMR